MSERKVVDIPELVAVLRDQQARTEDLIAGRSEIGADCGHELMLHVGPRVYGIQEQVHTQLAAKTGIPKSYYDRMLEQARPLLTDNINHWLQHKDAEKRYLVRTIDNEVRALLSNRYRPISHLDLLTIGVQVITGQDGDAGTEKPWARGARCLNWQLSPTNLDVRLFNPNIHVDLNNIDRGVTTDETTQEETVDRIFRRGLANDRTDWGNAVVYPSALIRNSETGHGMIHIEPGLMEGLCTNFNWYGKSLQQRHLGRSLDMEDDLSSETYRKMNAVIFSKAADILRGVFDPQRFLETCKRFKGLQDVEINLKEAVDNIVGLPGMTEDLRDDILSKYGAYKANGGRKHDNLFDLNRAVTEVAQSVTDQDRALALEQLGGEFIERGVQVID